MKRVWKDLCGVERGRERKPAVSLVFGRVFLSLFLDFDLVLVFIFNVICILKKIVLLN